MSVREVVEAVVAVVVAEARDVVVAGVALTQVLDRRKFSLELVVGGEEKVLVVVGGSAFAAGF